MVSHLVSVPFASDLPGRCVGMVCWGCQTQLNAVINIKSIYDTIDKINDA